MFVPLAIWGAWALEVVLVVVLVDRPSWVLATPVASVGVVLGSRRIRGRMSAVDLLAPLALLYPIADSRAATLGGWCAAAATSVLPLVLVGFARRAR
jgi:hypothetical protein